MSESQPGQPFANADDDAAAQTRLQGSAFALSQEPVTPEGPHDEPAAGTAPAPAYEHLGELPVTYGTQSVYLVAYDPHQLFAYWDLDWKTSPGTRHALHILRADGEMEAQVDISAGEAGRYVPIARSGGTYYVELGRYGRDGGWLPLASSGSVTMPPDGISGDLDQRFATLPFHLSFQRLIELIQHAMGRGEDLTAALSRLQKGDREAMSPLLGTLGGLSGEQIRTLEALLGQKFEVGSHSLSSPGGSSEGQIFRDRPEALSSGGAFGSEALTSGGAFGSESLSSGAGAAGGSEFLTSGGAFGSESLSSGAAFAGGAFGSESITSGGIFAAGAFGSESLSSGAFSSEQMAAAAASMIGSEWLSSGAFSSEALSSLTAAGPSSEAWRMAQAGVGGGSDLLSSEQTSVFFHAVEKNLDALSSFFGSFGGPGGGSDIYSAGW